MKFSPQLVRVILPITLLTCILLPFYNINWPLVLLFFVLFGLIGNGVVGHRLIAHRQFNVANWLKPILYLLTTLGAIGPVWYWRIQHLYHHKHSDTEKDIHSPHTRDFFTSFFGWSARQDFVDTIVTSERISFLKGIKDPYMKFYFHHTYKTMWAFYILLFILGPSVLLSYFMAYWIEVVRLGLITTLAHMKLPFSYRNFETTDKSYNNIVLGYLTLGFGWHNNHHAKPMELDTKAKWWEFDIEAQLAKLLQAIPGAR